MDEALRKKYIPMTETIYYTLLAVTTPRHGYAIMQFVGRLTQERLVLGTGTLYTMVGRLTSDGIIEARQEEGKKAYLLTPMGLELLGEETKRLGGHKRWIEEAAAAKRRAAWVRRAQWAWRAGCA